MLSHTVLKIHSDPDRMQLPESSCDSDFEYQSEPEEVSDFFPSISSTLLCNQNAVMWKLQ